MVVLLGWAPTGTYDLVETAALLSERFVEVSDNAGLPPSRWSGKVEARLDRMVVPHPAGYRYSGWNWPWYRVRMNTARNSIGRQRVAEYYLGAVQSGNLRQRTRQDQVAGALAAYRFRHRAGRDPHDFQELVAAGLLQGVPMDHETGQSLAFDLKTLFEWPRPQPRK